jgi:23S rRNA (cytosine1962-C5)-methyltransferase
MAAIILKPGREKSLLRRHPWIFSGAIAGIDGQPEAGDTVDVRAADGVILAKGAFSPHSQITVRVWSFDPAEEIDPPFFRRRLERALAYRNLLLKDRNQSAYRLVHAESDNLPGIIVDRYEDYLVCQFLSAGAERWKKEMASLLNEMLPVSGIYDRSDPQVREKEGLPPQSGILSGEMPPALITIQEGPCQFLVDVQRGHKTGFYLDQRENRNALDEFAEGTEVLNCFSYTGAFGIRALKSNASKVTHIESSGPALEIAKRHAELNRLDATRVEHVEDDVFHRLREYRKSGRQFDLIILDPPKFVESRSQIERASRGYKDINLLAFQLLRRGGLLFTFSCSGLMPSLLFQKIVADAALDAHREAQVIRFLSQSWDHPTSLSFPEGTYLKGLICRVW